VIVLAGLTLIPVAFVVWAWVQGHGFPYFKDANESYLSYVQARVLTRFSPSQTFFLTFEDTRYDHTAPFNPYTHNPNLPRYVHLLLLEAGIASLPLQILLITTMTVLATLLVLLWFSASLARGALAVSIVLPLVFALDTMGFLSWVVNTYRVFSFLLVWGALASVVRPAAVWVLATVSFLILQYEYGFALFAMPAVVVFAVALHGRAACRALIWLGLGAAASIVVFGTQVLLFYGGPAGVWAELQETVQRRGPAASSAVSASGSALDLLNGAVGAIATNYQQPISWLVAWSMLTAPVVLAIAWRRRGRGSLPPDPTFRIALAKLQGSLVLGCLVSALTLGSYFGVAFVDNFAPCLVFVVVVGLATAGLDLSIGLRIVFERLRRPGPVLAWTLGYGVVVTLMLLNAGRVFALSPPLEGAFVPLLQNRYRGLPFIAPDSYHNLVFALTWGQSAPSPRIVTAADLPAYADLRTPDGQLYYLCIMRPVVDTYCYTAAGQMLSDGHEVVDWGDDFVIMRLAPEAIPLYGPMPPVPDRVDQLTWLPPLFDATRWAADGAAGRPISRNPSLQLRDGAIRGWDVLDRRGASVERARASGAVSDSDGWLELRSRASGARLGLRSTVDAGSASGASLLARVTARGFGTGLLSARLKPVGAPDTGPSRSRADLTSVRAKLSGTWQTLLLRLEPDQTLGRDVELVIELLGARPDDRLDVWQVEIVAGSAR
jgi:hypothetical protein